MMNRSLTISLAVLLSLLTLQACGQSEKKSETNSSRISAAEFQERLEDKPGIIIDVRTQEEYDAGHLAIADRHHDLLNGDFKAQLSSLDKDTTYYLYCRSGNRSGQATALMKENGFTNVYNIGGFQDLVDAGMESQ